MKKPIIIIIVVLVAAFGIGAFLLMRSSPSKSDSNTTATDTTQTQTQSTPDTGTKDTATNNTDTSTAAVTTITYSNGKFSPSTITVKAGDTVEVKNTSGSLQFNSDPHPSHTDNPELNIGSISSGSSKKITVTSKGTWGYHNHLDPSETGTIIVQ